MNDEPSEHSRHAPTIAVCSAQDQHRHVASSLASQLAVPFIADCGDAANFEFLLFVTDSTPGEYRIELHFPNEQLSPVLVDFLNQRLTYRQKFGGGRNQAIARAIGLKKGLKPTVVDATAGLGRDAFILASLGCRVWMLERHPVIHALLADGLRRLTLYPQSDNEITNRLHLSHADSRKWLLSARQPVDVVYLDPMYPHRSKSALVKKEMRILRRLVGYDLDTATLLATALQVAQQRVVVKRPKTAPPIGQIPPTHSIEAKKTRFDVYLTRSQPIS